MDALSKASARERRSLQIAIGILGLIPISAGLSGIFQGTGMIAKTSSISLDSHYRYLSGLLLAIGVAFWSMIPDITRQSRSFRLLTAIVFVGGLSRLLGIFIEGLPSSQMLVGLTMELVVTPLLCFWQARLARGGHQ